MTLRTNLRRTIAATAAGSALAVLAGTGLATAQPPQDVFDRNDDTWACFGDEGAMVPPHHCLNARSKGATGLILVFEPDDRGPAEGVSDERADDRPCPHDDVEGDGTWWQTPTGVYVCHHRPAGTGGR